MADSVSVVLRILLVAAVLFYCTYGLPASVRAFQNYVRYAPSSLGLSDLLFAVFGTTLLVVGFVLLFNSHVLPGQIRAPSKPAREIRKKKKKSGRRKKK